MDTLLKESKILICDDSVTNVMLLQGLLESDGYSRVQTQTDSRQVVPAMQAETHDLLLLDIEMPNMDGFQVMAAVAEQVPSADTIPMLVLTGHQSKDVRNRALESGAQDFLTKPFDADEVLLRVRNLLRIRQAHVAQAQLNADLEKKVERRTHELSLANDILIEKLAQAGEMRDTDTGRHVMRVGKYARVLAHAAGLPDDLAFMMEKAAPLHDLGKIGIPDAILLKNGRLTPDEREVMNGHAELGAKLLDGHRSRLVQLAASVARTHHEKWDGTGYPVGVSGESIPVEGRIAAIADVFDALTTRRPYKAPWSIDEAVSKIKESAGSHFDPELVRLFEENLDAIIEIRQTYDD